MLYENQPYGQARIQSYVPTIPALRYLNCCTMVGWHSCNELYCQNYPTGVNDLLMIYTISGNGIMETAGKKFSLCQDSLMLVPPHTPMKYATNPQAGCWEFYWLDLTGERALSIAAKLWQDQLCFIRKIPFLGNLFDRFLKGSCSETECSAMIGEILEKIISEAVFDANNQRSPADRILSYLSEHYSEPLSLRQISMRFYLSQNQIIRIVRAKTGYTPHEYLVRFRLAKACELLQYTPMPISEICHTVGYHNNSHFSAAFRHLYGISPAEYRSYFAK